MRKHQFAVAIGATTMADQEARCLVGTLTRLEARLEMEEEFIQAKKAWQRWGMEKFEEHQRMLEHDRLHLVELKAALCFSLAQGEVWANETAALFGDDEE